MTAAPFILAIVAFLLFGIATDRHHGQRLRRPCPRQRARALRAAGWICLAIGFLLSLHVWGGVFGPIGWMATVMSGAVAAFCALNFVPVRKRA
uniref:DUF3325 domain-containing protein n=1 Tax=uncultured Sphingomonas sp. TaxID=158754 RepID=UPI0035C9C933